MDASRLEEARDYALTGGGSGCITRGGRLVMSWKSPTERYHVFSATKSIGVTALGLAIKDGLMRLDDKARQHHPTLGIPPDSNADTGWPGEITIRHLASMTAGFDKPGGYERLLFAPGTKWAYSDGGANWLAECVTHAYGRDLNALMFERVFTPLGITSSDLTWRDNAYREDTVDGIKRREFGAGISINVEAMAQIGRLYLRGGRWENQEIIPESFVEAARSTPPGAAGLPVTNDTKSRFAGAPEHYGLLWWNNADGSLENVPRDAYWAFGMNENLIAVIPSLDIVVGRAGSAWPESGQPSYYKVLEPFLGPIAASVAG